MRTRTIRAAGIILAGAFAAVGLAFLITPSGVVTFFNRMSAPWGFPAAPVGEPGLYVILAVSYMVVVTALAVGMARQPGNPVFPRLLALAKIASSVLSLGSFALRAGTFVVLVNGVVDGLIGLFVLWLSRPPKKDRDAAP
ncbi:MAG: hypothetical protein H6P96_681 [Candidatus Aminicenantes bacterium]|jgi:hypothetical protein|nr:hypothetical protein [Candidatus Aminicenantes bacterium]MBS1226375.1 hypothetical protein [Candidatus Aminicenantes bacterium]